MSHKESKCETYGKKMLNNIHRSKDEEGEYNESAGMKRELKKKREARKCQRGKRKMRVQHQ